MGCAFNAFNVFNAFNRVTQCLMFSLVVQGVKLGDMQATVQGFLSTGLFFVISNSTPLPFLSAQRPHPTIFSLYVFLSVLGQAAVHLALLVSFYFGALHLMPQVCSSV